MDSLVVQTAIGLVFVFATFAGLVSVLTETASRAIGLRGEYLLRGLRSLLDEPSHFELRFKDILPGFLKRTTAAEPAAGAESAAGAEPAARAGQRAAASVPWVTRLMEHPLISTSADKAAMPAEAGNTKLTNRQRRDLPSYIPSRSFATAMINLLVPGPAGATTMTEVRDAVENLPAGRLKDSLLTLVETAGADVDRFRTLLEQWYDDHMARVSGWYKRHVRWISLAIAAVLVLAFNLSALQLGRSLYTDQALNASVVTTATAASATRCQSEDPTVCLEKLRAEIQQVRGTGLPIGWSTVPDCAPPAKCGWAARHGLSHPGPGAGQDILFVLLLLVGWALMIAAILPGARFWFDALGRLGTLRSSGPKPAST